MCIVILTLQSKQGRLFCKCIYLAALTAACCARFDRNLARHRRGAHAQSIYLTNLHVVHKLNPYGTAEARVNFQDTDLEIFCKENGVSKFHRIVFRYNTLQLYAIGYEINSMIKLNFNMSLLMLTSSQWLVIMNTKLEVLDQIPARTKKLSLRYCKRRFNAHIVSPYFT